MKILIYRWKGWIGNHFCNIFNTFSKYNILIFTVFLL